MLNDDKYDNENDVDTKSPYYRLKWYETEACHYIDLLIKLRDSEPQVREIVTERLKVVAEWLEIQISEKESNS